MSDPIAVVSARMAEIKPEIVELGKLDTLNETQQARWNELAPEFDLLEARKAELEERRAMVDRAARVLPDEFGKHRDNLELPGELRDLQTVGGPEARSRALDLVEQSRDFRDDAHRESVTRLIEKRGTVGNTAARLALATAGEEYREAWLAYLSGRALSPSQSHVLERAMTAGTGSSGGYFVPLYLDPTMILTGAGTYHAVRSRADVRQISTLVFNGVTAAQITASEVGEGSAFSDNAPTAGQVALTMLKAGAYVPASFEAFEDIENLANDVSTLIADAKNNYEGNRLSIGTGSGQPTGVVTATTAVTASRVAPATGGAFVVGDVYKLQQSLDPRFRRSDSARRMFMCTVNTINLMRQFATANVYHAFLTDLAGGQPPNLLGDDLEEASDMVSTVTTGTNLLVYGDFSRYLIVDRIGMQTEFIPNLLDQSTGRPSGQRAWLAHWRWNANVSDANAFRVLKL